MQTIYIDISNKNVIPIIYAKQGEVGRKFLAVLTDGSVPYSLPAGCALSVWYDGDSGEGNYTHIGEKSAFYVDGNRISIEMITQMLSVPGKGNMCLVLNYGDNQVASWNIEYVVESVPGAESEKAKEYYTAFSKAVSELPYPDETLSIAGKPADAAATGAALMGKAPAGYGLGLGTGDITQLTTAAQVDAAMEAGWYQYYGSNINGNGTAYGGILVVPSMWSVTQFFFCRQHYGSYMKRIYQSNAWNPWEWINPPMLAGVEYRTTERYMGKPVYAKLVDCKGMPSGANAAKTVQHNSANVESIVSFGGNMSVGGTKAIALPYYSSDTNLARISVDTLQVRISNGGTDLVGYNDAKVWFKYTKTTA